MTISDWRDGHYGRMADQQSRTFHSEGAYGRAANVTKGFAKWRRFNPTAELIWAVSLDGQDIAMTRKQADLLDLARQRMNSSTTIRDMALTLGVAPSSVSRGMIKLMSWGLLAFTAGRGRYGGITIFSRSKDDGLDLFVKQARAKITQWRKAAEARVLRTKAHVASLYSWKEITDHGYGNYYLATVGATMKRPWTAEDMAEIV